MLRNFQYFIICTKWTALKRTLAVPRSVTTQTSIAVFPLITVTFVGVVGSMYGANVVEVDVDVLVDIII